MGEVAGLEFTPTWVVATVCAIIVAISLVVERFIHYAGKWLKEHHQHLNAALGKVKEELMLLGFISLMLTVLQGTISKICIPATWTRHMLPCSLSKKEEPHLDPPSVEHDGRLWRMLSETTASQSAFCASKQKVPFLSVEALHHLHIFIFVLAVSHVVFCALTVLLGEVGIRRWKHWEDENANEEAVTIEVAHVHEHESIQDDLMGVGKNFAVLSRVISFFKQFRAVTRKDYLTLRKSFILKDHNFHDNVIQALHKEFEHVVGVSWYLWVFVVIFMLLNVNGCHTYLWIAFVPLILLLVVGAEMKHVITKFAHELDKNSGSIEGKYKPYNELFWFNNPRTLLFLIHFILFQNAFEIAFSFWIWVQYGFNSCMMDQLLYVVPRLIIGVIIQVLCSYSTVPLYAIVTGMGTTFEKAYKRAHKVVSEWHKKVKVNKKGMRPTSILPVRSISRRNQGNEAQPNGP